MNLEQSKSRLRFYLQKTALKAELMTLPNKCKALFDNYKHLECSRDSLFLLFAMLVFAGFFVFSTAPHRVLLYISFIVAISSYKLYRLQVLKEYFTKLYDAQPALICSALLYLLLNSASILWTQDASIDAIGNAIKLPIFISTFCLSMAILFRGKSYSRRVLEISFVFAAPIAGFVSIYASIDNFSLSDLVFAT